MCEGQPSSPPPPRRQRSALRFAASKLVGSFSSYRDRLFRRFVPHCSIAHPLIRQKGRGDRRAKAHVIRGRPHSLRLQEEDGMSGWNVPPPPPPPPQGNYTNNLQSGPPLPPRVATRSMGGVVPDSNFSSNGGNVAPPPLPSWTETQGMEAPQPQYVPNVMPPSLETKSIHRPDMRIRMFHSLLPRNGISMSLCPRQYPVTGTSLSFPSFTPCPAPSPHSPLTPHSHPLSVGCELGSPKARQAWDDPHEFLQGSDWRKLFHLFPSLSRCILNQA